MTTPDAIDVIAKALPRCEYVESNYDYDDINIPEWELRDHAVRILAALEAAGLMIVARVEVTEASPAS